MNARSLLPLLVGLACAAPSGGGLVEGVAFADDGTPIVYDVRGSGEPALVFVHCWACHRGFWREQLDVFADEHRVVSLDLPGHGASGAGRERWSVAALGGDVAAVVEALDLERVILVGHSMGGPVSLAAAARLPDRVIGIVAVDTLHDVEYVFPPDRAAAMVAAFRADFDGTVSGFVDGMFADDVDPALVEWVAAAARATPEEPAVALMADFGALDLPALMRGAGVPIRAINASTAMTPTAVGTNRRYADFDAVVMDDVGHYVQLERPTAFNAHLRAAIAELAAR